MDRRKIKHMAMIDLIGALCLDRELNDEEFEIVRSYSRCMDWRVRMAVAENLGIVHTSERTVKLLKKLARDRNEMVTIQAVKSLGARGDESCAELLGSKLGSRSYITRGYAGLALAELAERLGLDKAALKAKLSPLASSDESEWVRVNHNCALFLLGEEAALDKLLDGLKSEDYRVCKASASCLDMCIDKDASIEPRIKEYMKANFTTGTEQYDRMMADVMEDEFADMLAEEMNKLNKK